MRTKIIYVSPFMRDEEAERIHQNITNQQEAWKVKDELMFRIIALMIGAIVAMLQVLIMSSFLEIPIMVGLFLGSIYNMKKLYDMGGY